MKQVSTNATRCQNSVHAKFAELSFYALGSIEATLLD